ncbi:hypothetical protein MMC07_008377 [Pseudocyphellaria aurata]|nr:hypothetical protein [Pseudocyphellaria aurata]
MATPNSDPDLTPAGKPPPGVSTNLKNPPSDAYVIVICMVVYLLLTTPIVLARMYTRQFINRHVWWDDYTCVLGLIGLFAVAGLLLKSLDYGNGVDYWNVSVTNAVLYSRLYSKLEIIARISIFLTKLSILLLFLRIFVPSHTKKNKIYYSVWIVVWFNLLFCLALVFAIVFACVAKHEPLGPVCSNSYALALTASSINIVSDVIMLIIPLVAIWDLQMAQKRKLGIGLVFAVGMLAVATSISRLAWQVQKVNDPNKTVVGMKIALLAIAEHAVGLIVACMPILPALYNRMAHLKSESRASKTHAETWRTGNGTFANRRKRSLRGSSKDPYLLSSEYKELDEIENGNKTSARSEGTSTTIHSGVNDPTIVQTVEGLHGSPESNAIVSSFAHGHTLQSPRIGSLSVAYQFRALIPILKLIGCGSGLRALGEFDLENLMATAGT